MALRPTKAKCNHWQASVGYLWPRAFTPEIVGGFVLLDVRCARSALAIVNLAVPSKPPDADREPRGQAQNDKQLVLARRRFPDICALGHQKMRRCRLREGPKLLRQYTFVGRSRPPRSAHIDSRDRHISA